MLCKYNSVQMKKNKKRYIWLLIIIPMLIVILTNQWYPIPSNILSENIKVILSILLVFGGGFALYKFDAFFPTN